MVADDSSRAFIADLVEIGNDVRPRLEDAERKAEEIRAEALSRVDAACLIWASQSERPGVIRQAAKVATMKLERGESCGLSVMSARAVVSAGFADSKGTGRKQRAKRGAASNG